MKFTASAAILIFSLLFSTPAFSQDYTWHAPLSLSLSLNHSQLREENINSNPYSGPGLGLAIARRIQGDLFCHVIEVSGYGNVVKSEKSKTTKAFMVTGSIKYSMLLENVFGNENIHIGLFGQISVKDDFFKNRGHYGSYWANFCGLGGAASFTQPISDHLAIEAWFEIPLAGANFRPVVGRRGSKNTIGHLIKYNTADGNFALPGNYLSPSIQLLLLRSGSSFFKSISYKYTHYEVKTSVSNLYWENSHAFMITFGLKNAVRS